jgi:hypothetical protein
LFHQHLLLCVLHCCVGRVLLYCPYAVWQQGQQAAAVAAAMLRVTQCKVWLPDGYGDAQLQKPVVSHVFFCSLWLRQSVVATCTSMMQLGWFEVNHDACSMGLPLE